MIITEEKFRENLHNIYTARYPIIAIETFEEEETLESVKQYIKSRLVLETREKRIRRMYVWDRAEGYRDYLTMKYKPILQIPSEPELNRSAQACPQDNILVVRQIVPQLSFILDYVSASGTEPTCWVLLDIGDDIRNNVVERLLKRISQVIRGTPHMLILLQQAIQIPANLEKEILLLDYAVPGRNQYHEILSEIIRKRKNVIKDEMDEEQKEMLYRSLSGLTTQETPHVLAHAIVQTKLRLNDDVTRLVGEKKKENIRKSGLLEIIDTDETIKDVGGLDNLKAYLEECKLAFSSKSEEFGIKPPKGFLAVGPPGSGKTMCAKATAGVLGLPLIRFDVANVFAAHVGASEKNIAKVQRTLEQFAPAVVLIDEIDKALAGLKGGGGDSGVGARVLGSLLTFMNDTKSALFFVGTANSISLPPEILRKGRWDELFFVDLPQESERQEIFQIHLRRVNRKPKNFDLKKLAKRTDHFSGAEISNAIQQGLRKAFVSQAKELTTEHILLALEDIKPLAKTMEDEIRNTREFASNRTRMASSVKTSERHVSTKADTGIAYFPEDEDEDTTN
jgi:SpoVK/Ycf46/Vps4 family AAA+-type ATPase